MEAVFPEEPQCLLMTPDRKDLRKFQHPQKITIPKPLLPPPNPRGGSARCVPSGLAQAAPLQSGTARQSGTGVPCGAQSWRCAGNTPTFLSQDHALQECSRSCFLLLSAAGGGGDSSVSALRSCNNLRINVLTQEVGQWALGPPQPQGFRVSISHEAILNPKLLSEGEVRGTGRRGGESIHCLIQTMLISRQKEMKEPRYPKVTFRQSRSRCPRD